MSKFSINISYHAIFILILTNSLTAAVILNTGRVKTQRISCTQQTIVEINRTAINLSESFIVFEAHSQWYNLSVSFLPQREYGQYENGTNIGVIVRNFNPAVVYVGCQSSKYSEHIDVLLKATVYRITDPVPGGCNQEFPLEEDPNIHIIPASFTTQVAFQYSNIGYPGTEAPNCEKIGRFLHYSLYEYVIRDTSDTSYVQHMTDILMGKKKGQKISEFAFGHGQTTKNFVSYLYQGSVFSVEVLQINSSGVVEGVAMYVPVVSYGYKQGEKYSKSAVEWTAMMLLVLVGIVGIFIAFLGHRFFQIEMFFFGYLAFKIILLFLVLKFSSLSLPACGLIALCCGLLGGVLWWLLWFFKGIPFIAVLLPGFTMGFVLANLLFNFTPLGHMSIMQSSLSYGTAFASAILLPTVILLYFTKVLNLVCCCFVGSFLPLFAASQFFSGHFSDMVLDTFKAAKEPAFLQAVRNNKPNVNDIILLSLWAVLFISSLIVQFLNERKRPPFPPCPYQRLKKRQFLAAQAHVSGSSEHVLVNGEREPLLQPQIPRRNNNSYGTGLSMISQDPEIIDPL